MRFPAAWPRRDLRTRWDADRARGGQGGDPPSRDEGINICAAHTTKGGALSCAPELEPSAARPQRLSAPACDSPGPRRRATFQQSVEQSAERGAGAFPCSWPGPVEKCCDRSKAQSRGCAPSYDCIVAAGGDPLPHIRGQRSQHSQRLAILLWLGRAGAVHQRPKRRARLEGAQRKGGGQQGEQLDAGSAGVAVAVELSSGIGGKGLDLAANDPAS